MPFFRSGRRSLRRTRDFVDRAGAAREEQHRRIADGFTSPNPIFFGPAGTFRGIPEDARELDSSQRPRCAPRLLSGAASATTSVASASSSHVSGRLVVGMLQFRNDAAS